MVPSSTIPIHAARSGSDAGADSPCGACPHDAAGAHDAGQDSSRLPCLALQIEPGGPPELSGPADTVQRVLLALGERLGFDADAPEQGGVRALHLKPGEAELQLAVPPRCAGAAISNAAFETLRGLLPDTDIYVTHSAS